MSIVRRLNPAVVLTTALVVGCGGGGGGGSGGGGGGGDGGATDLEPSTGAANPGPDGVAPEAPSPTRPGGGDVENEGTGSQDNEDGEAPSEAEQASGSPLVPVPSERPEGGAQTQAPAPGSGVTNSDDATARGSAVVAQPGSVLEHVRGMADVGEFLDLVEALGLEAYLADAAQRVTLIVPSDAAFAALTRQQRRELSDDDDRRRQLFAQLSVNERRITPATLTALQGSVYASNIEFLPGDDGETVRANGVLATVSERSDAAVVYRSDAFPVRDAFFLPDTGTIASRLGRDARFGFFTQLLDEADLLDALGDVDRVHTVFAVSNEYFASAGVNGIEFDIERHGSAEAFAGNHIVARSRDAAGTTFTALSGLDVTLTREGGTARVNGRRLREADRTVATNGVVDVIDYPLLGTDASGAAIEPTNLLEALRAAADRHDRLAESLDGVELYCCDRPGRRYGYDESGNYVVAPGFNAYRFFVELVEAAGSEYLFEDTDAEWTLLLPRDGSPPRDVTRGYGYGDNLDTDPETGGVAPSVSRYVDYLRESDDSFSLVPDLVPDVAAAQDLLYAHLIRTPISETGLAELAGRTLRAVDGSALNVENGYYDYSLYREEGDHWYGNGYWDYNGYGVSVNGVGVEGDSIVASNGYVHLVTDFLSLPQGYVDHYSAYDPYAGTAAGAVRSLRDAGGYDSHLYLLDLYLGPDWTEYDGWTVFVAPDRVVENDDEWDEWSVVNSALVTYGAFGPAELESHSGVVANDGTELEVRGPDDSSGSIRVGGHRVESIHAGPGIAIYTIEGLPGR